MISVTPHSLSTTSSMKLKQGDLVEGSQEKNMRGVTEEKGKETVTFRAVSHDEEGRKRVEKVEVEAHKKETLKYIEKKLEDKGVARMERHPADGLSLKQAPPKSGHGGKFTWEGPQDLAHSELDAPPAVDEKDPNYVDEEEEEEDAAELIVGEVEVAKVAEDKEGVARIEVDPNLIK